MHCIAWVLFATVKLSGCSKITQRGIYDDATCLTSTPLVSNHARPWYIEKVVAERGTEARSAAGSGPNTASRTKTETWYGRHSSTKKEIPLKIESMYLLGSLSMSLIKTHIISRHLNLYDVKRLLIFWKMVGFEVCCGGVWALFWPTCNTIQSTERWSLCLLSLTHTSSKWFCIRCVF